LKTGAAFSITNSLVFSALDTALEFLSQQKYKIIPIGIFLPEINSSADYPLFRTAASGSFSVCNSG
jgi:hypothetical protein